MNKGLNIRILVGIIIISGALVAWFGWMTFSQAQTQWMQTKVVNAMDQGMQYLANVLPRIQVTDNASGEVYYAPDLNSASHAFDLYGQTLINLNQDASIPPVKLSSVTMTAEYGASETTLQAQTSVEFALLPGINKVILVHSSIQIPHYQTLN